MTSIGFRRILTIWIFIAAGFLALGAALTVQKDQSAEDSSAASACISSRTPTFAGGNSAGYNPDEIQEIDRAVQSNSSLFNSQCAGFSQGECNTKEGNYTISTQEGNSYNLRLTVYCSWQVDQDDLIDQLDEVICGEVACDGNQNTTLYLPGKGEPDYCYRHETIGGITYKQKKQCNSNGLITTAIVEVIDSSGNTIEQGTTGGDGGSGPENNTGSGPIACAWCTNSGQCSASGGNFSEDNGYCSVASDGCCAVPGAGGSSSGGGGGAPAREIDTGLGAGLSDQTCGELCNSDADCRQAFGPDSVECVIPSGEDVGQCVPANANDECRQDYISGGKQAANCDCGDTQKRCGEACGLDVGLGCGKGNSCGFFGVESGQCDNNETRTGRPPTGFQACVPKVPHADYTKLHCRSAAPDVDGDTSDLAAWRITRTDATFSTNGMTKTDLLRACTASCNQLCGDSAPDGNGEGTKSCADGNSCIQTETDADGNPVFRCRNLNNPLSDICDGTAVVTNNVETATTSDTLGFCGSIDANNDGVVNTTDLSSFASKYGKTCIPNNVAEGSCPELDIKLDGKIGLDDFSAFARNYNKNCTDVI